jgi:tetratricopeptide (TPR) repeat protein
MSFTPPSSSGAALQTLLAPALATHGLPAALAQVRHHFTDHQLVDFLSDPDADIRKLAALALGYLGNRDAIQPLAIALHDPDAVVHEMAEHGMWAIWFRSGKSACLVKVGSADLSAGRYECAIEKLSRAIEQDPAFSEAYNQRAIGFYLMERYRDSIKDCEATLHRMPQHFGAMAGMGHCHSHLGEYPAAERCYRLALAINPRLEGIEASLEKVRSLLHGEGAGPQAHSDKCD